MMKTLIAEARSLLSLSAGWYIQSFPDEVLYFKAVTQQKNGGWAGNLVTIDPTKRSKPKVKKYSVPTMGFGLWKPVKDVPKEVEGALNEARTTPLPNRDDEYSEGTYEIWTEFEKALPRQLDKALGNYNDNSTYRGGQGDLEWEGPKKCFYIKIELEVERNNDPDDTSMYGVFSLMVDSEDYSIGKPQEGRVTDPDDAADLLVSLIKKFKKSVEKGKAAYLSDYEPEDEEYKIPDLILDTISSWKL